MWCNQITNENWNQSLRFKSQIENLKFKMKNKPKSIPQFNTKIVGGNIVILWREGGGVGTTPPSPKYQTHLNLLLFD